MNDEPRNQPPRRDKDASTRFMRVDQLWAAPTVAVPAAELLARAADARRVHEAPTVARAALDVQPLPRTSTRAAAASPAPTVAQRRLREPAPATAPRLIYGVAAAVTLISAAIGLRYVSPRAQVRHGSSVAQTVVRPDGPKAPAAAPGAARAATALPSPSSEPPQVTPTEAADQLAAGADAAALASYQALAAAYPNDRAFALVAQVLAQRAERRCPAGAASLGTSCAP